MALCRIEPLSAITKASGAGPQSLRRAPGARGRAKIDPGPRGCRNGGNAGGPSNMTGRIVPRRRRPRSKKGGNTIGPRGTAGGAHKPRGGSPEGGRREAGRGGRKSGRSSRPRAERGARGTRAAERGRPKAGHSKITRRRGGPRRGPTWGAAIAKANGRSPGRSVKPLPRIKMRPNLPRARRPEPRRGREERGGGGASHAPDHKATGRADESPFFLFFS